MSIQTNLSDVPPGYWRNARGDLVLESKVQQHEKERDQLVKKIMKSAQAVQASMAAFKSGTLNDVHGFVERCAERHDVNLGGKKGNVSLLSYDGRYKIQYSVADRNYFDERIHVAKALIDECIDELSAGSNDLIRTLVMNAFDVNKEGRMDVNKIYGLTKHEFKGPEYKKWNQAMEIIKDSRQVASQASYLRVYERIGDSDNFKQISLDLASL